jgi:predicted anti-sigma-YlaC factor YlaD
VGVDLPIPVAFAVTDLEPPHLEIRINFGVFAGREATPAELDELGRVVIAEVGHVTLVSEHRHELGGQTETSLHQVRMDVPREVLPNDVVEAEWTRDRLVRIAERWARSCIDARHAEVIELFPAGREEPSLPAI